MLSAFSMEKKKILASLPFLERPFGAALRRSINYAILPLGQKSAYRAENDPHAREARWTLQFLERCR